MGGCLSRRLRGQQPGGLALLLEITAIDAGQQPDGPSDSGRNNRAGSKQTATRAQQGLAYLVAELSAGWTFGLHPHDQQRLSFCPAPSATVCRGAGPNSGQHGASVGLFLEGSTVARSPAGSALEPIRLGGKGKQLSAPSPGPTGRLAP